jgi:hypothetical protein
MALDRNRLLKPVKKLRNLVGKVNRRPTPEQVHDLRTRTRQIEAIEGVVLDGRAPGKSLFKNLNRFRKRAGKGVERQKHAKKLYAAGKKAIATR